MKKIHAILIIVLAFILLGISVFYIINKTLVKIKANDLSNSIIITSPIKNEQVSSPLRIVGRARGDWFVEGAILVELTDLYGNHISSGSVSAQEKWATKDFVAFLGTLQFNNFIKGSKANLILYKNNQAQGNIQDKKMIIPIMFK